MFESRIGAALERQQSGYLCSQAIGCTYCDLFGVDEETMFRITEPMGLGLGIKSVCGAVNVMAVLAGLKYSAGQPGNQESRKRVFAATKQMIREFQEKNQSIICSELKGLDTGVVLRSCGGCVKDACELIEKHLLAESAE